MNLTTHLGFFNLSKPNFFDKLQEKFPKSFKIFSDWIDNYKKEVKWSSLFLVLMADTAPKFHDIPYEMQYGILLRFFAENGKLFLLNRTDAATFFESLFQEIETEADSPTHEVISHGANAIFMERLRQVNAHGYDVDWDKSNNNQELTKAAMWLITLDDQYYPSWWSKKWCDKWRQKPLKDRKIAAGALIAADLDREIEDEKLISVNNETKEN